MSSATRRLATLTTGFLAIFLQILNPAAASAPDRELVLAPGPAWEAEGWVPLCKLPDGWLGVRDAALGTGPEAGRELGHGALLVRALGVLDPQAIYLLAPAEGPILDLALPPDAVVRTVLVSGPVSVVEVTGEAARRIEDGQIEIGCRLQRLLLPDGSPGRSGGRSASMHPPAMHPPAMRSPSMRSPSTRGPSMGNSTMRNPSIRGREIPTPSSLSAATAQALSDAVRSDRLYGDLDFLATTLQTRYYNRPQMVEAWESVHDAFVTLGLDTWYDVFTYSGTTQKNVVGVKTGTVDPDRIYLVGGHLDATSQDPSHAPGAEDNGSGSAAVLEIARLLAGLQSDYTIWFVCFAAEERGLIGSEHLAAWADAQDLDIRAVLNLDMVGYAEPGGDDLWLEGFESGVSSVWLMDLLEQTAEAYTGLSVYRYPGDGWGSDHVPFHEHGFSAVLSIDYDWFNYPCYHRTCDTVDNLDPWVWRSITAVNAVALAELAGTSAEPGDITGEVTLVGAGDVTGATVGLRGTGRAPVAPAPDGRFSFAGLFPGTYRVVADKAGFAADSVEVVVGEGALVEVSLTLESLDPSGTEDDSLPLGEAAAALRIGPNPTRAGASIRLELQDADTGELAVFAADGRRVARLAAQRFDAGGHLLRWDGRDAQGRPAPSGTYWIRWSGERRSLESRLVLLR